MSTNFEMLPLNSDLFHTTGHVQVEHESACLVKRFIAWNRMHTKLQSFFQVARRVSNRVSDVESAVRVIRQLRSIWGLLLCGSCKMFEKTSPLHTFCAFVIFICFIFVRYNVVFICFIFVVQSSPYHHMQKDPRRKHIHRYTVALFSMLCF